jgi:NDP-sugar pyrophosphorylase family protein
MQKIRHAVIMAAGRGQRMMPLTETTPKPLASFRGTTLVGHSIDQLKKHVPHIHVTVGYKAAQVASYLLEHGVSSVFNTEGQPNAWWLSNTLLRHLDEPVMVLTCDHVVEIPFDQIEHDYYLQYDPPGMLVPARPVDGVEGDYIFHNRYGQVTKLSRSEKAPTYASGIQVINPTYVHKNVVHDGDFSTVWQSLIALRRLNVSGTCLDKWFSVDTVDDLEKANREHT